MPVFWNVLWAPDSNGFALMTKVVGHPRLQGWDVYFRSDETFRKIELPETDAYSANVVWAPDLKRFAFNLYSRTTYATVAFYQLRNDKWVALQSPVDKALEHTQLAQLARKYSPKNAYRKGDSSPVSDYLEARSWTDANTVILYAYSEGNGGEAAALFTLKFDEAGKWKIVKTHQMSKKEIEKEDAGEDVSGPAQTTNQEGLSADASFHDADRHLNEVYNAQLENLKVLRLYGALDARVEGSKPRIKNLPKNISNLKNLEELDLGRNGLKIFPSQLKLSSNSNLKKFNLSFNEIHELPSFIGELKNLVELDVSGNSGIDLPKIFSQS